VEFVPFKAAIDAGVAFIMTAHVLAVALDDQNPATLSRKIVTGILHNELGFRGVIVSDDLEMNAIANTMTPSDAAVAAIAAGCDSVLICGKGKHADVGLQAAALEALVYAVEEDRIPLKQIEASLERNRQAKQRFLQTRDGRPSKSPLVREWRPPSPAELKALIGCDAHRAVSDAMSAFV
jgi:beta-glucosidase-like glycosyl hydrolase